MSSPPIEARPPDEVEHVLGFAREQNREKAKNNAGHRHYYGGQCKVPGERRKLGLTLHDAAQPHVRRIEDDVQ